MTTPDRRLTPDRPIDAPFRVMRLRAPVAPLRPRPAADCGIDTEIVFGETCKVFDETEGWAYAQAERDGYVGWLSAEALEPVGEPATHRVAALRTFIYAGASIKLPDPLAIPQGALVTVTRFEKDFAVLDGGGYMFAAHLKPADAFAADYVSVAEAYVGVPYLWGGRTSLGLDCSGLMQTALREGGVPAPRDSDMLERFLPLELPIGPDFSGLRRGDAVFWKGHVGVMRDAATLLHANGHHMAVASEPLAEAAARILEKSFGPVTSIRRLG
jgi:cell wall-associated NlpC family hydrolase